MKMLIHRKSGGLFYNQLFSNEYCTMGFTQPFVPNMLREKVSVLLLDFGDASPAYTHKRSLEEKDKQTNGEGLTSCRQMTGVSVLHKYFFVCLLNRYQGSVFGKRSRFKKLCVVRHAAIFKLVKLT